MRKIHMGGRKAVEKGGEGDSRGKGVSNNLKPSN